ncbi:ATP synthase F1 subunit delta [Patescibacteria group bacterium]|nr:MAG: ATP synthase F1 subunit delta [Patescibacteria group bacterium]
MKITAKQYARTLTDLTEGKSQSEVDGVVASFVEALFKNGHLKLNPKIIDQFGMMWNTRHGVIEAEVTTKEIMESSIKEEMIKHIMKKYSAKEVVLKNKIDAKVLGGMIIKVGDEVLDGSVAGQLSRLKNSLEK